MYAWKRRFYPSPEHSLKEANPFLKLCPLSERVATLRLITLVAFEATDVVGKIIGPVVMVHIYHIAVPHYRVGVPVTFIQIFRPKQFAVFAVRTVNAKSVEHVAH